jgi:ribose transport system substrate-binding protein
MTIRRRRVAHSAALATGFALAAAMLAACSTASSQAPASTGGASAAASSAPASGASASGSQSGAQAAAQAKITADTALPTFTLDAPAFDVTKAKGKTVLNIPITEQIPYVKAVDDEMKRVATKYGVKWINYQNNGTPTDWSKGVDYGIAIHANLIILHSGINPATVIPALERAKAAGIPVMATHTYQVGQTLPASVAGLLAATTRAPFQQSGELQADYVVAQSGCAAQPVIITAGDLLASAPILTGMQNELKSLCPSITPGVIDVPVAQWGTNIKPDLQSYLVSHPTTNWVMASYDDMVIPTSAAIQAVGKGTSVRVTSYNGTPANVALIQEGNIFSADMGESIQWLAWSVNDQAFRILSGVPPVESGDEGTPLRVIDDSNVAQLGTPPGNDAGYGTAYVAGYEALWKTQG